MLYRIIATALLFASVVTSHPDQAAAHSEKPHANKIGEPGTAAEVDRTISIDMTDSEFDPSTVNVSAGDTIRFIVKNSGELVHEFNIGTAQMHAGHREEMMTMMDKGVLEADRINHHMMGQAGMMKHDDPNALLLEPGKSGEIIWTFVDNDSLEFGCNVPGHYESGMVGKFHMM